jgi:site-specific recombinase XerD
VNAIGPIVYAFFEQHLKGEKGLSPASVKSYRDALRLLLTFIAAQHCKAITRLAIEDLTAERVRQFLSSLKTKRGNHIRTRNQRLAALHTFFAYLARQVPEALAEAERVAAIPTKRTPPPKTQFLERDEIESLFAGLPKTGWAALCDRTLLLFLYNTGARVQEVANLRIGNLVLEPQPRVHLHGKGDKWRTCPLWPETARLLCDLLANRAAPSSQTLQCSHRDRADRSLGSGSTSSCAATLPASLPVRIKVPRAASRHTCSAIPRRCICSNPVWRST